MKIKDRRITSPNHIRQLMNEQINLLRQDESITTVERARSIAYLSTVSLTAMKDGDLSDRIEVLEEQLKDMK